MEKTDYKELASKLFCFFALGLGGFLFFKYALGYFLPFIIAWAVAYLVRPIATELHKRTKVSFKVCSFFLVLLMVVAVFSILFWLLVACFMKFGDFCSCSLTTAKS